MAINRSAGATDTRTSRPRLPRRTVRLRLTLLYGVLLLASGAALVGITYLVVWNVTYPKLPTASITRQGPQVQAKVAAEVHQHAALMRDVLAGGGIALAVTAALSIALGWFIADRALRPVRAMIAATQRIGEQNLHRRLAVAGPEDELKQLGDTIDDLLERLEGAFDAQRRFVANASHELRTPLTMMRTALDVATTAPHPPPPAVTILAERVRLGLDRADRLVESFLALARPQYDGAVRAEHVALERIVAAILADHATAIGDKCLTVGHDQHDAPVRGSGGLLTHLADNLIENAIRHNHPGGWIHIASATQADVVVLVVENSGAVLDPARVPELTQPFRRVATDRTDTVDTGVGLGLSIVTAVVSVHGGTLDLHARPDGGLRVTVRLPLDTQAAPTPAASR